MCLSLDDASLERFLHKPFRSLDEIRRLLDGMNVTLTEDTSKLITDVNTGLTVERRVLKHDGRQIGYFETVLAGSREYRKLRQSAGHFRNKSHETGVLDIFEDVAHSQQHRPNIPRLPR